MFEEFDARLVFGTILFLGWELLALLTIGNIIMKARSAAGAWGWSMAVIALPFIAVPLYWILGRHQFVGYVEKLREAVRSNERITREVRETLTPHYATLNPEQNRYAGVLDRLSERRFTKGNGACLLIDGEDTFAAIFQAIREAKKYVLIQSFIVNDDALGNKLRELLLLRSREGIRIYFIYDEIGSHKLGRRYVRSLREAGVEIHDFHSTQGPSNRFQINFRNHRKIIVVDGRIGFVGGHNIGDEYLGQNQRFGAWRDTHVRLIGPSVLSLQIIFLGDYYWAAGQVPELDWNQVSDPDGSGCGDGEALVLTLPTGPIDRIEGGTIFFLNAITRAKVRIWIATPYFVTDESIRSALQMAALRGVEVRIMIPDKPDKIIPWLATFSVLGEMDAAGVEVWRYQAGFMHQKVLLVDEAMAAVGTANLDNRSMRLNFEVTAVVLDPLFVESVEAMLREDFARCRRASESEYLSRPLWFRLGVRLARLASPVL